MSFRCAAASLARDESLAGTASTVRAFLLVEHAGPWGVDALRDARLPPGLGERLKQRAAEVHVRTLLVRRPGGRSRGATGVRVFAALPRLEGSLLETAVLPSYEDLVDLDVEALGAGRSPGLTPHPDPVLAVCTQGRHDACCAERGRPVATALAATHPDLTWEISHIGGDRFAGNLLVLPWGLYYGRVEAPDAPALADALLAGDLPTQGLRGRTVMAMPVQVAEIALRRELGVRARDGVRFVRRSTDGDTTAVVFAVRDERSTEPAAGPAAGPGTEHTVTVRTTRGEDRHLLTCRALREGQPLRHEVLGIARGY